MLTVSPVNQAGANAGAGPSGSNGADNSFGALLDQQVNAEPAVNATPPGNAATDPAGAAPNPPPAASTTASTGSAGGADGSSGKVAQDGDQTDPRDTHHATPAPGTPDAALACALAAMAGHLPAQAAPANASTPASAGAPDGARTAIAATSGNGADKRLAATVGAALLKGADANGAAQGDAAPGAQIQANAAGGKVLEPDGAKSGKSGAAAASPGGSRQTGATADGQSATQNALLNQVAQAVQASQANQATQSAQAAAQVQATQAGGNAALASQQPANPLQAAAPLVMTLTPHLDDSAHWGQAFSQQVVWLSSAHQQSAALQLNPPDLGPLHVVLNVADNQAQALFVSAHAAVRDAVQAALPQLRASLANNGIALGNTMVSADSSQQQQAFQQFNDQARQNSARQSGPAGAGSAGSLTGVSATTAAARIARGLVDTFA